MRSSPVCMASRSRYRSSRTHLAGTSTSTTILQAPVLSSDADRVNNLPIHCKVERRIVWNLLTKLSAAGFEVVAVDDGEDTTKCANNVEVKKTRDRNDRGQACYRWVGTVATRGIDDGGSLFGEPVEVYRAAGSRTDAVNATWKAAARLFADLLRAT